MTAICCGEEVKGCLLFRAVSKADATARIPLQCQAALTLTSTENWVGPATPVKPAGSLELELSLGMNPVTQLVQGFKAYTACHRRVTQHHAIGQFSWTRTRVSSPTSLGVTRSRNDNVGP